MPPVTIRPCCAATLAALNGKAGAQAVCSCNRVVQVMMGEPVKRDMRADLSRAKRLVR